MAMENELEVFWEQIWVSWGNLMCPGVTHLCWVGFPFFVMNMKYLFFVLKREYVGILERYVTSM